MDALLLNKLEKAYQRHDQIIVGVDFDDTIFPWDQSEENINRCQLVVDSLVAAKKKLKTGLVICLYSVADDRSLVYKGHIMQLYKIGPDYINKGPIDHKWESKKPYFNILLDDKGGLNESLETFNHFIDSV